jgi:hypothetical protein
MRVIQAIVGFVLGAGFIAGLELLGIYLISMASSGHLAPKGIGWFIAPLAGGFIFARACAENRQSRLFEVWFVCAFLWLVAAGLYYRYGFDDRNSRVLLTVAAGAYLPVFVSFAGLLLYRRFADR